MPSPLRLLLLALPCLFFALLARASGTAELSIDFRAQPIEKGLSFERAGLAFAEKGGRPAWVSRHRSVPADEWARSFLVRVTDAAAQRGKRPLVEGEIVYWHEANTAVEVLIDSASGSRKVASGWGSKAEWQTLRFRVEDAHFGARSHGNPPEKLQTDGYDLRINAAAGDFYVSQIRLWAHDLATYVDFSRSLTLREVSTPDGRFVVDEGRAGRVTFVVANEARRHFEGQARLLLLDWRGRAVGRRETAVRIAAGGSARLEVDAPATLEADFYYAQVELQANDPAGERGRASFGQTLVVAKPDDLFFVFDRQPISRGLEVEDRSITRGSIRQGFAEFPVWESHGASEYAWGRTFRFKVTDPRFRNGQQPAVDLDVVYRTRANASVGVIMDTAAGVRRVGEGWGRSDDFQRFSQQIDDAHLGGRTGGTDDGILEGADFRVNSYNDPLALRAVRLRGYATRGGDVNLTRLLRFDGIQGPRSYLVSPPNTRETLRYQFRNLAESQVDLGYRVTTLDWEDKELTRHEASVRFPARGRGEVPVVFDSTGLRNAVYRVRLEVFSRRDPSKPVFDYETYVGVSSVDPLPRAQPGEFLYGMDSGQVFSFDWFDYLGVDITRRFPTPSPSADQVARYLETYEKHGMSSMIEADPPGWVADPRRRAEEAKRKGEYAAEIARRFKGRIKYWELGNEPDLTFFYEGPMKDYVEVHAEIARAILKADPDAVVMNGGLCFAGEEGDRRAREFIKLVPDDSIVAWAYHAHGPGAGSQRRMHEMMVKLTREAGKDRGNLYFDTESGVSAVTRPQQIMQAATCVQKFVYAQSVKMPAFFWFRKFITGGDWAYTNLKAPQEPRPVMLSYRNMVQTLRGLAHSGTVDLESAEAEGHYFESADGRRRALVLWANRDLVLARNLSLAATDGERPKGVEIIDLFGNRARADVLGNGTVPVTVTSRPIFVTWRAPGASPGGRASVAPSLIEAPARLQLSPGLGRELKVAVRNPAAEPLEVELLAQAGADAAVALVPAAQPLTVPPRGEIAATVRATAEAGSRIGWPVEWSAFLDVIADEVDPARHLADIPDRLPGVSGAVRPRTLLLQDNRLELQRAIGREVRERRAAMVYGWFDSPVDATVRVGAAADWWFACYVNGRQVYSTMDRGNGGSQTLISHTFDIPVRKGRNLVAFKVLSGSMGFLLVTGGPDDLRAALTGSSPERVIELSLKREGRLVARQAVTMSVFEAPRALRPGFWDEPRDAWFGLAPQFTLDAVRLRNLFEIEPDSRRWYRGAADLSAEGWIATREANLVVALRVKDDEHRPASASGAPAGADRLALRALAADGRVLSAEVAAQASGPARVVAGSPALTIVRSEVIRRESERQTLYLVELPRQGLRALNLRVQDSDETPDKQTLTWLDGWDDGAPGAQFWYDLSGIEDTSR
jgi:hypothetical protein